MPSESSLFSRRSFLKLGSLALVAGPRLLKGATPDRCLSFYNIHTTEKLKVVYWADGGYVPESLAAINYNLRDHRTGTIHEIDRRLMDLLWRVQSQLDTTEPFQIISGYRSPETNALLRSHSTGVATHSLHMDGMAADVQVPGRSLELIRKVAISMNSGGVGYYPTQFVHIDVGRVRTW